MPKTLYLPESEAHAREGIDITWTPTTQRLSFGGWYDSFVGIESTSMTLREFFDKMGINEGQCIKAFRKPTQQRKQND